MGDIHQEDENYPKFIKIEDMTILTKILKQRIPKSSSMFNAALKHQRFSEELTFYTKGPLSSESWIISVLIREDYGNDISISGPEDELPSEEFKNDFINFAPFDWKRPYMFSVIDSEYAPFIIDASIRIYENCTTIYPSYLYYMSPEESAKIDLDYYTSKNGSKVEVKQLSEELDKGISFFLKNWNFAKKHSDVFLKKITERNESSGVFINDQLVAANGLGGSGIGLMSQFYTLKEFRNQGLGTLCKKFLIKKIAESGCIPICEVEINNVKSKWLAGSVGLKESHKTFGIFFTGSDYS